jgi:23S rRNA A2030 N6-methylase RlmJ
MARALELLRHKAPQGTVQRFLQWVKQKDGPMDQVRTAAGGLGRYQLHSNHCSQVTMKEPNSM